MNLITNQLGLDECKIIDIYPEMRMQHLMECEVSLMWSNGYLHCKSKCDVYK